ncbi:MAG: hypothetical protein H8E03_00330 [Pelagibacteraceae bacterium]|nr:hypothetical protein [Pelagibacteraceae bacterium]
MEYLLYIGIFILGLFVGGLFIAHKSKIVINNLAKTLSEVETKLNKQWRDKMLEITNGSS